MLGLIVRNAFVPVAQGRLRTEPAAEIEALVWRLSRTPKWRACRTHPERSRTGLSLALV